MNNWNPNQNDPYSPPHSAFQPKPAQASFGNDPYGQNPYAQTSYGQSPYGQNPYGPQPPKSGGGLMWLWIVLGVLGVGFLLCCGCCGGLAYVGMNEEEQEIQAKIADDPVIVEHIGEIQSINRDWGKSIDDDDANTWYFRIKGTLGEGDLILREEPGLNLDDDDAIKIEWAKLRLDSGEEFDVLP